MNRTMQGFLRESLRAAAALAAAAFLTAPALAHHHGSSYHHGDEADAPFDYFILSMSWSPTFCASNAAKAAGTAECDLGRAFVVHGLWPQSMNGGGPEHCDSSDRPDRETIARTLSAMPDEKLVWHEWSTHGTCSGMTAHDYFVAMLRAAGSLTIPDDFDGQKTRHLSASEIAAQFIRANPKLPPRSIAVRCKGELFEELRICFSPELQPIACGQGVHSQCRGGSLLLRASHGGHDGPALH
jgi:ribonuclease T2